MNSDARLHHRRSIRLKGYDYTQPGAYFVTIVSHQRDEIFGTVVNDRVQLSPLGDIIHTEWFRSSGVRKEICLFEDEFVVMPNHIHGIVWIKEIVGADGVRPPYVLPKAGYNNTAFRYTWRLSFCVCEVNHIRSIPVAARPYAPR